MKWRRVKPAISRSADAAQRCSARTLPALLAFLKGAFAPVRHFGSILAEARIMQASPPEACTSASIPAKRAGDASNEFRKPETLQCPRGYGAVMEELVIMDDRDNIAVVMTSCLSKGSAVAVNGISLTARDDVPFAHKVAIRPIARGERVFKYGEPVGRRRIRRTGYSARRRTVC